ncbi:MAG: amino acid adenylation domain-containing protein, partial [Bacteroidales bacterium]|nr:amino acid adenylation domain-containing protein [Bacteroidales bacterium]
QKLTIADILYGAWGILLSKYSGETEMLFGTTVSGRNIKFEGIERMVGLFINTIPIRIRITPDKPLISVLKENANQTLERGRFENVPLLNILDYSGYKENDLIESIFVVENYPLDKENLQQQDELAFKSFSIQETTNYKLTVSALISDEIEISFNYINAYFERELIENIEKHYVRIIDTIIDDNKSAIQSLDILSDIEKHQLLYEFNDTKSDYPKDKCIHQLFEAQVRKTPDKIAIVDNDKELTFNELNTKANCLSTTLREYGVIPNCIVSIYGERSSDLIVSQFAVLKAGGAFLPIDSLTTSISRCELILDESNTVLLLSQNKYVDKVSFTGEILDIENDIFYSDNIENITNLNNNDDLVYVIYTSGSSGKPKGVMVEHRNYVNAYYAWREKYNLIKRDINILQIASFGFDVFAGDIARSLLNGGKLVICNNEERSDLGKLLKILVSQKINVFESTPGLIIPLFDYAAESQKVFNDLELIIIGSDILKTQDYINIQSKYGEKIRIINSYGVTEATIDTSFYEEKNNISQEGNIPIGKPMPNMEFYVLNNNMLQPVGVSGELCIGGDGLARGYLNNCTLTSEKFTPHPFKEGNRLYRTGDLARCLPDGNIEFLGRIDLQVKIRGFRIELGEIENVLQKHVSIKESVVIDREENGEKYLCAYLVKKEDCSEQEIRSYLSTSLPDYMIPSYFVELDKIPLTDNGKINRKVLPAPEIKAGDNYEAPSNEIEEKLLEIWSKVLNINKEDISVNANFFSIGGHSLKATILTSNIHKEIGVEFPLQEVFLHSTIKSQANQIAKSTKKEFISIPKAKEQSNYLLSAAQKRLYLLQQFDLTSIAYNMPYILPLGKEADKSKIENVFKQLINRHESFRTSIILVDQEPVQLISKDVEFELEEISIESTELENTRNKFTKPFDLSKAPLLRVAIVDIKGEASLLIDMHHIISDGISHTILEKEFQALLSGEELSPLSLQYKDYSEWQNSKEQQEIIKDQEQYWLTKFEGEIPVLSLPIDYVRPLLQSHEGATVNFVLSKEETEGIRFFTEENDLTLYMSLLSAFSILLSKLSGQDDIIVGTPIAGRNHVDLENIVGMFVNTLSIRNEAKGEETIQEFVSSLKQTVLEAFENQNYQFEDLVDKVSVERDASRNPIFDVMFNLLNQEENIEDISGFNNREQAHEIGMSKFDLTLTSVDYGEQILFSFTYCKNLFNSETIDRFISYFKKIIADLGKSGKNLRIKEIEIIPEILKQKKLSYFNDNLKCKLEHSNIQAKLEETYSKYKDNVAIETGAEHLTYSVLNNRKQLISNWVIDKNIEKESLVGIFIDDKTKVIISILGILDSSCVFVPIDTNLPVNRIKTMIDTIGLKYFITGTEEESKLSQIISSLEKDNILILDDCIHNVNTRKIENKRISLFSDKIYIYFTSGSSGTPKPIIGKNESLLQFIEWEIAQIKVDKTFRVSQLASIGFDASLKDIFVPLLSGGTVCIPYDNKIIIDEQGLSTWIDHRMLTLVHCVPSVFKIFSNENVLNSYYRGLEYVLMAGEQISLPDLANWYSTFGNRIQMVNLYGATETTLIRTFYFIKPEDLERSRLPIGQPIPGSRMLILDKNKNVCDVGISGELYIRTAYSTYGYYNDNQLTKEKFIKNPFISDDILLYRTGDVAVENTSGEIEIIGRIDHQVKIRGIRIELGEIESTLLKHENIKASVVLAREENEDKYLCAYLVTEEDLNQEEIRTYLSASLPDYMIPSYFVELESLPLNANGKVNRKALPSPEVKAGDDYAAPSNEIEEKLVEIWSKVLNINKEDISVNANFFSIGGHSLKATVLTSNIHKEIGVEFPLRDVFLHQTIKSQASRIEKSTKKEFVSIPKAKEQLNYPLSSAQKRLYLLQQFDLTSTAYNMPNIIPLGKEADKEKIETVFKQLINRHESFRTSIIVVDQDPVQLISKDVEFEIGELSIESTELENTRINFIKPFDLSQAPFLRAAIVDIKGEESMLMIDMHHIISDGSSHAILEKEFQALLSGEELAPLPLQYKDYSQWQNSKEQQELKKNQEQYWLNKFEGEIPVLNLPIDYVRPLLQNHEGATVDFVLSKEETKGIKIFTKENDLTLYMTLLSVFSILLSKLSGQDDIIVGTPIAGRNYADLENIVGMFVNTLSIRNEVKAEATIRDFVSSLKQTVLGAYENQNYQFEDLVDKVSVERDTSRNPIFDVVFNLLNQAEHSGDISGIVNENLVHIKGVSKFDLALIAAEYGDQLMFRLEYCTQLFKAETIDRFIVYFKQIVSQLARKPEIKITEIDIITEAERKQLLFEFNDTQREYPREKTIYQLFEEQVERTPENTVLVFEGKEMTYRDLNSKSNQLARLLRKKGVGSEMIIGLMLESSFELIIGIMGILKAGGAYLPIDPMLPESRKQFMLNNSHTKILLTVSSIASLNVHETLFLDSENNYQGRSENLNHINESSDSCYIIYTSGSTGVPKAVVIEHTSVVNFIYSMYNDFKGGFSTLDSCLSLTRFSFDVSVAEYFLPMSFGAKIVFYNSKEVSDIKLLTQAIVDYGITFTYIPPSLLRSVYSLLIQQVDKVKLNKMLVGVEPIKDEILEDYLKLNEEFRIINAYGPTEATICATRYLYKSHLVKNTIVPIGQGLSNSNIYLLDQYNKLVPISVLGELCISGVGLSRGYLNNPELSREKFIDHPFKASERLYKTGDLARLLPDGNIEFVGRIDYQVKIRGFRVELGEIENAILKHENIKESVVLAREENGDKYLCAYILSKEEFNQEEIRTYLSLSLPDYMIPSYFIELEKIPLTTNGKVNRKALPSPEIKAGDDYVAPSNEIEEKLLEIWSEVLNIEKEEISVNANFFSIGGHSLKATVLTSNIHKEIGVEFPLREIFLHPTIKSQASQIEKSTKKDFVSIPKTKEQSNYLLSPAQKRLYVLQQFDLTSIAYNMLGIISLGKEVDKSRIEEVFKQLINRHENFRTSINIVDQVPVQLINKDVDFDLEELSIESTELEHTRNKFIKPFDLSKAPFLRAAIVDIKEEDSLLMIDMHHIISDGTSHSILEKEFRALLSGEELAPLPLQYKDYSEWQNSKEQQELIKNQEQYWLTKFEGEIPVLNLPIDYARPLMQSHEGATVNFVLSRKETDNIKLFTKENELTLYMSLLSVFSILLSKLSGQDDIVVGTPIAGRNHADLENIVGMFVNTLSIPNEVKGNETIQEFVSSLKQTVLGAYENQNYQFEDLVDKVSVERDISRNPIFDVLFNLLNQAEYNGDISEFNNQEQVHDIGISKFDLTLTAVDYGEQLMLSFEYCTQLFKAETIDRFILYFKKIVSQLARTSEIKISEIDIITEAEKHQLLYEFNNTEADYPKDKTIHQLFEEQVERSSESIALVFNDQVLTYKELNLRSNQLAQLLLLKGLKTEDIVGIFVDRSIEMIIGILGILKAGGTYLPLDIESPKERIQYIIKESRLKIILSRVSDFEGIGFEEKFLNLFDPSLYLNNPDQNISKGKASDAAYIIYTSGSSGKPKGVIVEHGNVVNLVNGLIISIYNNYHDTLHVSLISPIYFDASVKQIFPSLTLGHSLNIISESTRFEGLKLVNHYTRHDIQIVDGTPFHAQMLAQYVDNKTQGLNIRQFIIGGDELKLELMQSLFQKIDVKNLKISNVYGPTECADVTTIKTSTIESLKEKTSIGKPISNYEIFILGKNLELLPIGVSGELCISGAGVSRGYLYNEELTSEKFIENPFKEGERLYKTGDIARWLPDGNVEFLGRIDHQVKIRGFRIELGEIENALQKHVNIKESVVISREENGEKYLCAYLVTENNFNEEEIRTYLSASLPDYMIPAYFVELESLPINANGKVNRKVLPSPEIKAGNDYVAPSTETEEKLLEIWSELLNINKEDISVNANFFFIGGHSLKATILTGNIHKKIGVEFPLRDVFLHPTIKSQASQIEKSTKKEFVSIPKTKEQSNYPLSPAQKRLYVLQQFDLTSTAYNMPGIISLGKEVDKSRIEEVFKQLINRHESFRTSINVVDNEPIQLISKDVEFKIEELSIENTEIEHTRNKFIKPFDLSKAPFLRATIVDIKGEESLLMIDIHHIISDGTSHAILEKEFQALLSGEELAPLPLQYRDYSQWQNSKEQQELIKNQEQYWLNKFEGEIPVLNLPIDYARPLMQSHEGATVSFVLSKEDTDGLRFFTKENGLTLYMSLLSVFSILLSKLSGQDDIVVGTPIAGRNHADLESIVGMFINTLSIPNEVKGEETIREFVSSLKQTLLGTYENQNYQFEDLVDKVSVARDTSRNPIFDVLFNLLNQAEHNGDLSGFNNQEQVHEIGISKFDLTLIAVDYGEQLMLSFEYCTQLFKAETIDRFIVYFKQILIQLTETPETKISEIDILSEEERQQILYAFNDTQVSYPSQKSIPQVFNEQVKVFSKKMALEDKDNSYTYQDLDEESNKIANYLIKHGVTEGQLVGLMAGRSSDMIIGILGILKTGGAYVPIDPAYPKERVNQLIEDSGINILLSTEPIDFECNLSGGIIKISDLEIKESSTDLSLPSISSSNIAYVMYTSGSTGTPKGVVIEQKSVLRLVQNNQFFPFHSEQKILLTGAPVFDATTFEIWGALLNGGSLYIASNEVIINSELLGECIRKNSITSLWLTASLFNQLVDQEESIFDTLNFLLVGGDVLSVKHINKVRRRNKDLIIINGYGPTENTTFSTTFNIDKEYESNIPIGKPISNSTAYIFDKSNRLQAVGVPGELLVGGDGLAREYLNNLELTREKFIENPYKPEERLYKTGDLARCLPDGNIEFLGRIDQQVKIRGFRIELGEIENALLKHKNIKESVVLAREENGEKYLCAYIVNNGEFNEEEIRTYLLASLPDYMIPSYFVELESLPLNANGKVNRKILPSPEIKAGGDYAAPSTKIEENLVEIWSKVLNIDKEEISVNANFFSIGGHSLKATVLTSNIHKELGVEFPLRDVFLHSTIKSQASQIEISTKKDFVSIPKAKEQSNYPLSSAQKRLYLLQQFDLTSTAYNMPGIISLGKEADKGKIEEVFKQLINRHESFRTSIIVVDQEPVQLISQDVEFELGELSIENTELENTRNKFIKPFDLSKAPLLRASLVDIKGEDSLLMLDMHHIISDGTSHTILEKEFQTLFSGEELAPLPLQYKDYSQWQNSKEQQDLIKNQEQYWLTKFEEEIPVLNLPNDYVRPLIQSHEGATVSFVLSKEETEGIKYFTKENDLTLYMSLLSVFSILLSKLSGQDDIVVGTPIAGRNHADLENIVGIFINTLSIPNEVKGEESIQEFVSSLKQTVLGAYENQNYQFEDLVDKVSVERDTSRNPIF